MTDVELKVALLKAAEEAIDEIVAWSRETKQMTLTQLEDEMLESRQRVYARMTEVLLAQEEAKRNAAIPVNAKTQKRLHPKGAKKKGS
jgi:hypothetical protein